MYDEVDFLSPKQRITPEGLRYHKNQSIKTL